MEIIMTKKEMACIVCPMSCHIEVTLDESEKIVNVTGNTCKRGESYVRTELTNPVRILTSTVKLSGGLYKRLPVITSGNIPKHMIYQAMNEINKVSVCAPVKINDVIIKNVCGLNVDIVAGRSVDKADNTN